jgi:hypothetical protein
MNNAVEELRANTVRSIEQIMMDQVINYMDGLGPCTTVECLLSASVEAARIFILERQMHGGSGEHGGEHGGSDHLLEMLLDSFRETFKNPKNFDIREAKAWLRNQIRNQMSASGEAPEVQIDMMMDMLDKNIEGKDMESFVDGLRGMFEMMSNGDGQDHM